MVNLIVRDHLAVDEAYRIFVKSPIGSPYSSDLPTQTPATDERTIFYRVPDAFLPALRDRGIEFAILPR